MTDSLAEPAEWYLDRLREFHVRVRDEVRRQQARSESEEMSSVAEAREGDTIYGIDLHVEEILFEFCEDWGRECTFTLVAEGIEGSGARVFPDGADAEASQFILIVDPVDGTRGLMYNKRSAWILSGVAPNRGPDTALSDIQIAVQTELPTSRAFLSDQLWATLGGGAHGETQNLLTGARSGFRPAPSRATTLEHGFASIAKFFPGGKALTSRLEEDLYETVLRTDAGGNPLVFDDQYICTGGQLYELMVGHDRFTADLRPVIHAAAGLPSNRLCAHPYDLAAELIAREAGVLVSDPWGRPLGSQLDIRRDVAWVGYCNETVRRLVQPRLQELVSQAAASVAAGEGEQGERHR